MIKLRDYLDKIEHKILNEDISLDNIELSTGYVSDLLSDVMGSAKDNMAWFTIMRHMNVIAVASMADIPCIVFGKNVIPDPAVISKASEEGIVLVSTSLPVFDASGKLYQLLNQG